MKKINLHNECLGYFNGNDSIMNPCALNDEMISTMTYIHEECHYILTSCSSQGCIHRCLSSIYESYSSPISLPEDINNEIHKLLITIIKKSYVPHETAATYVSLAVTGVICDEKLSKYIMTLGEEYQKLYLTAVACFGNPLSYNPNYLDYVLSIIKGCAIGAMTPPINISPKSISLSNLEDIYRFISTHEANIRFNNYVDKLSTEVIENIINISNATKQKNGSALVSSDNHWSPLLMELFSFLNYSCPEYPIESSRKLVCNWYNNIGHSLGSALDSIGSSALKGILYARLSDNNHTPQIRHENHYKYPYTPFDGILTYQDKVYTINQKELSEIIKILDSNRESSSIYFYLFSTKDKQISFRPYKDHALIGMILTNTKAHNEIMKIGLFNPFSLKLTESELLNILNTPYSFPIAIRTSDIFYRISFDCYKHINTIPFVTIHDTSSSITKDFISNLDNFYFCGLRLKQYRLIVLIDSPISAIYILPCDIISFVELDKSLNKPGRRTCDQKTIISLTKIRDDVFYHTLELICNTAEVKR